MAEWAKIPWLGVAAMAGQVVSGVRAERSDPFALAVWGPRPWLAGAALGLFTGAGWMLITNTDMPLVAGLILAAAIRLRVRRTVGAVEPEDVEAAFRDTFGPVALAVAMHVAGYAAGLGVVESVSGVFHHGVLALALTAALAFGNSWLMAIGNVTFAAVSLRVIAAVWAFLRMLAQAFTGCFVGLALSIFGLSIPAWWDTVEAVGASLLLYGAVTGALWIVSATAFESLLKGEDTDIVGRAWAVMDKKKR